MKKQIIVLACVVTVMDAISITMGLQDGRIIAPIGIMISLLFLWIVIYKLRHLLSKPLRRDENKRPGPEDKS